MFCKNCGNEMDDKAVICTKCGVSVKPEKKKKSIFKKWWFWVIAVVAVVAIAGGSSGGDDVTEDAKPGEQSEVQTQSDHIASTEKKEEPAITYEKIDLQTMLDELKSNALKAEKTYSKKHIEVVGKIANFDSDGSYITIEPVNADEWNFDTVMCYIKNDGQLDFLLEKAVGDQVTIRGQITSIGEVLGYSLNIIEVE